jgi:type III secretion protein J
MGSGKNSRMADWRRVAPATAASRIAALCLLLSLAACGANIELHHGLLEHDANEVIAALQLHGIHAAKLANKQGYSVAVAESDLATAVSVLQENGLPRGTYSRMGEVFRKDGMISTPAEERGRYLYALSQELESTLSQIDGVVLARVHPVLQERVTPGEAAMQPSCAVMIKYRSGWDPDAYEERIRRLVMAGIPGLAGAAPERISIVFVAASSEEDAVPHGLALGNANARADHADHVEQADSSAARNTTRISATSATTSAATSVLWLVGAGMMLAAALAGVFAWFRFGPGRQRRASTEGREPIKRMERIERTDLQELPDTTWTNATVPRPVTAAVTAP